MKYILTILTMLSLTATGLKAEGTNDVTTTNTTATISLDDTNASKGMPMELMLAASGVTVPKGQTSFGVDLSLSVQPLSVPIWFGISQEFTWQPSFAGATDLDAAWSFRIYKEKLYLNAGWSAGAVYDQSTLGWRSGPEISLEYYTKGNAFFILGANYDLINKASGQSWTLGTSKDPLRYFFGIGIAF